MNRVIEAVLPQKDVLSLRKKLVSDEESKELAYEVYRYFVQRLDLKGNELEALRRLMGCIERREEWDAALLRNNIFKAAHSLGMKLPSSSF